MSGVERQLLARLRRMPSVVAFGAWLMALQLVLHGMLMLLPASAGAGIICSVQPLRNTASAPAAPADGQRLPPCCVGGDCCCLPVLDAPGPASAPLRDDAACLPIPATWRQADPSPIFSWSRAVRAPPSLLLSS